MNAAQAIINTLHKIGVKYVFCVPGEEILEIIDAIRDSNINLIITRHEQGAAFMAATCGRLTGIPAICLTTLGPGAINALNPLAYSKLAKMPLILISGQKPIGDVKQGFFQLVDFISMARPVSYFSHSILKVDSSPSVAMQAYHCAVNQRGPVHIELPEDIASKEVLNSFLDIEYPKMHNVSANKDALHKAKICIEDSNKPLLVLGHGANDSNISSVLSKFVNHTKIPFISTQMGKGALDENLSFYLGTAAVSSKDLVHKVILESDLIIMVGHNEAEKPPFLPSSNKQRILHIDCKPITFNEVYIPSYELVGDIANSFNELMKIITPNESWDFDKLKKYYKSFNSHEKELSKSKYNTPFNIVTQIRKAMPNDGIVTLDNGMYKIWFARHYRASEPNSLLLDNALATMGAGLPSAMSAAILYPDKQVIAICGDGGFMMNSQELETALRLKLNLVVIILKDNAYGMIGWKQEAEGFENYGMKFDNPDFVELAKSYGAYGQRVVDVSNLKDAILESYKIGGVHLIELPIDYHENYILNHLDDIPA